jgi:hypothetical protein
MTSTLLGAISWTGLLGGLLIGLSAAFFLLAAGRVSGISGIIENALLRTSGTLAWSIAYLIGLPLGALLVAALAPALVPKVSYSGSLGLFAVAGFLVGFGARLAGGCTSGHGVCGVPRLSVRSIVATLTFMATAAATVFLLRLVAVG